MAGEFQETVYGRIAEDFESARLGDLCDPKAGVQTGPFGSQLHQEDYAPVGTPIITVEHLGENRILHDSIPCVTDKDRDRLAKYLLRKGDIVFSRVGSVDRRALVRANEDNWLFSGRCLRVRPNVKRIDQAYLSYFFGLPAFKEHIRAIAVGATMPSLNTALLSDVVIYFPKLDMQRVIAHILGTLDDKIELNRRMNETMEAMAQALFKSWFVDFEPFRDQGMQDSPRGDIPVGWELVTIGDLGEIVCGKTPPTRDTDNYGNGFPFITIPDMRGNIFVTSTESHLTDKGAAMQSNKLLPKYAVCVSCIATPGLVALTSEPSHTNQQINSIICHDGVSPFWCLLAMTDIRDEIVSGGAGGSATLNLNKTGFSKLRLTRPSQHVMRGFHRIAEPLFERMLLNDVENATLAALRDALLPKLLSGGIRVTDAEKFVATTEGG